jgi:conflict system pore-forming effector with SLATT domain
MSLLAIASAISVLNSPSPDIAMAQAMVLVLALTCAVYLYLVRPDRRWYTSRAVAESIKTITWRYICKAEPFDDSDDRVDQHQFAMKLKAIVNQNKDVSGLLTSHLDGVQISDEMTRVRQESAANRLNYYRQHRIVEQQSWYAKKASANKRMVDRYFAVLIVTIGIAIFFSIAKVRYPTAQLWPTDFFVTVAAGMLSWIQAKRFQELSASYTLAAHEISLIRQQAAGPMDDKELSKFIGDAENAFSREHTQWVARKDN